MPVSETAQQHAPNPAPVPPSAMTADDYRESLRRLRPVVYLDGRRVESVADEPAFEPGSRALGVSYDAVHDPALAPLMRAGAGGRARIAPGSPIGSP